MVAQEDGKRLLKLARDSVSLYFNNKKAEDIYLKEKYNKKRGCFVTLKKNEELRGCIGFPYPIKPLYGAIIESALEAAFSDSRFFPLKKEELDHIKFEISILTVPELIEVKKPEEYLKKIKIGKDGLIIKSSYGSGLLLPQVFIEYGCNAEQALHMTCQKANLSSDAWKDLNNNIYKFRAEIFSEE